MVRVSALEAVTFVDAALNCILRLERDADALAALLEEALRLSADRGELPHWQAWRAEALELRRRQSETSDRW